MVFAVAAILVHLFLSRTVPGRFIYAHGDNPDAARLTGLATRPLTMLEYALSSAIGYVGGVVMISETALMHLQVAESTLIFDVIMVVVLGGVSLVGGRGNVLSVVVGTLLIGVLLNGMTIMDMDVQTQNIIKGVVLLGRDRARFLFASARRGDFEARRLTRGLLVPCEFRKTKTGCFKIGRKP